MSELEEQGSLSKGVPQPVLNVNEVVSKSPAGPILIAVNANSPVAALNNSEDDILVVQQQAFDEGLLENNPATRGATSVNKRSKRPPAKPSSALLQAKLTAQQRKKRNSDEAKGNSTYIIKDHLQPARDAKECVRKSSGVIYDMRMMEHRCLWDPNYLERPERFSVIIQRCQELGLLDRCLSLPPRFATEEEVLKIHTLEHISKLQSICQGEISSTDENHSINVHKLEQDASCYDSVYFHPSTYDLSLLATGCTIDLVDEILSGNIQNGMAIIRPPGHHAMKSEFCGFCYFNNVAIAAQIALDAGKAERILIVDFDVHHGQATQQAFYNDPRILYFSTHRFEHGMFWPNLEESNFNFIGNSDGVGFNVNIPLNTTGLGNTDFLSVWYNILIPIAYQFNPDLVIVSAGYDAALGCMEFNPDLVLVSAGFDSAMGDDRGEMEITPQCYPHLLWPLLSLANGNVAVILEGGYCLQSLSEGAALTLRSLLGDPCPAISPLGRPADVLVDSVLNASYMLQPYWSILSTLKFSELDDETFFKKLLEEQEREKSHFPTIKFEWKAPKPDKYDTRNCYPTQSDELVAKLKERLDRLALTTPLNKALNRVALVYNDVMLKHRNAAEPGHPEKPDRISNIFACHADYGLLERCLRLEGRVATNEELLLVHTEEHIQNMKQTQIMSLKDLYRLKERSNSVYFHSSTYEAALFAAGSLLQVVDNVLSGTSQSGIAIIRPPGHHAEADEACGFCIFNNVSVAAKYALDTFDLKRILIFDWDIHHGNGIQRMFESDPRVLYISIHRFDYGAFFPCSMDADLNVVGNGEGRGFNVNIPWNRSGMGDTEYFAAFTKIVMPIAYQFNPELVLVSAGFDAAKGDPLGGCKVTPEGYAHMTHMLSSLANGKVILALEGGYNLTSIAYSMVLCTKALLGDPVPPLILNDQVNSSALETIHNVLTVQANYWPIISPFVKILPLYSNKTIRAGQYPKSETEVVMDFMENLKIEESNVLNNNEKSET